MIMLGLFNMGKNMFNSASKYFDVVEKLILVILLFATITAIGQEIIKVIDLGKVSLADILLLSLIHISEPTRPY